MSFRWDVYDHVGLLRMPTRDWKVRYFITSYIRFLLDLSWNVVTQLAPKLMLLQSAHHVCSSLTSLSSPSNTRLLKYACSAAFSFLPGSMLVARTGPGAHRCAVIMSGDVPNTPHSPASFRRNNVSLSCIRPQPGAGYDVCVIGGGIAGATAALQLARRGCLVTLVDMGKDRPG